MRPRQRLLASKFNCQGLASQCSWNSLLSPYFYNCLVDLTCSSSRRSDVCRNEGRQVAKAKKSGQHYGLKCSFLHQCPSATPTSPFCAKRLSPGSQSRCVESIMQVDCYVDNSRNRSDYSFPVLDLQQRKHVSASSSIESPQRLLRRAILHFS